ncbi:MAG TPA: response regulator, partial [Opitutaceae bacterium]|nr:response regulator [Opitutaceae bacterium]
ETLDLLSPHGMEKGLDMVYLVDEAMPPRVVGDVTRLRQVLVNLVGNAVKFTERGSVFVCVRSRPIDQPAHVAGNPPEGKPVDDTAGKWHELHFQVKDTGPGISADRLDRLFKIFSQVDASTTRRYGGTGLGLAISKRLVELMGGRVWVESRVDEGSKFNFTIQAREAPALMDAPPPVSPEILARRRLLIVDDGEVNRRILRIQAERWGMIPCEAESGVAALNWLRSNAHLDLAILDMQMPGMDGLELAAQIRGLPTRADLPLILLSSAAAMRDRSDPRWLHFSSCFTKPIKMHNLQNALLHALGRPRAPHDPVVKPGGGPRLADELPLRILLVEDNVVNQKVASLLLKNLGYRCDLAANGREAVDALKRQAYDVVLMDIQMPEMDGFEATQEIYQRFPAAQRPRIIALTAGAMESDREKCLNSGMDDYLSKPLRAEDMELKLRAVMLGPRTNGPASVSVP